MHHVKSPLSFGNHQHLYLRDKHRVGTITKSDLNLPTLILHKATLPSVVLAEIMLMLCSGLDIITTVSCSMWDVSATNPVVVYLLTLTTHIYSLFYSLYVDYRIGYICYHKVF